MPKTIKRNNSYRKITKQCLLGKYCSATTNPKQFSLMKINQRSYSKNHQIPENLD